MLRSILIGVAAIATVTSPASAGHWERPDVQLDRLVAGRTPGKPVDCINLSSATSSEIIEGKAIVYRVGATVFVNRPRSGADSLDRDDILVTRTFGSQLCSIDTVRLLGRASRFPHGFVTLGKFVPYTRVKNAS